MIKTVIFDFTVGLTQKAHKIILDVPALSANIFRRRTYSWPIPPKNENPQNIAPLTKTF